MPAVPQLVHVPPVQRVPAGEQSSPLPTHLLSALSQQSPDVRHVEPPQHASPVAPHDAQTPETQFSPLPVHALPLVQQGSFVPPHAVQVPAAVQTRLEALQALPVQHG